ncbi:MAG: hypothetical protein H6Q41_253 [Deltaproteobacteria bacterium]|nr:hypothetical protein [Deltaproteobacteria bacterium]
MDSNPRLYRGLAKGGINGFCGSERNNTHPLSYCRMVFSYCSTFHQDIQKGWVLSLDGDLDDYPIVECSDALFLGILELAESKQKSNRSIAR